MGHAYLESKDTAGLCQAIIVLMPVHSVYIESHLERGAIMKRKQAARRNIVIDVDAAVIAQFRCDYAVGMVQGCCHDYLSTKIRILSYSHQLLSDSLELPRKQHFVPA